MPRRAKTSLQPLHLAIIAGIIGIAGTVGFFVFGKKGDSGSGGIAAGTDLSIREFLDNSSELSGNTYHIEGTVRDRLDQNWKATDGRLLSVEVVDGGESALLPVLVPASLVKTLNIERDQRYRFKVTVQSETGVLEAREITKS